jgi:hypothetical protein
MCATCPANLTLLYLISLIIKLYLVDLFFIFICSVLYSISINHSYLPPSIIFCFLIATKLLTSLLHIYLYTVNWFSPILYIRLYHHNNFNSYSCTVFPIIPCLQNLTLFPWSWSNTWRFTAALSTKLAVFLNTEKYCSLLYEISFCCSSLLNF